MEEIVSSLSILESKQEIENFLRDLCTPAEIEAFAERIAIARLLFSKQYSYREISELTGASTTTVGRVARFLFQETNLGYRTVFERMNDGR